MNANSPSGAPSRERILISPKSEVAVVIAAAAYAIYRFFAPDYLEDFEDELEDEFDDDFFEEDDLILEDIAEEYNDGDQLYKFVDAAKKYKTKTGAYIQSLKDFCKRV